MGRPAQSPPADDRRRSRPRGDVAGHSAAAALYGRGNPAPPLCRGRGDRHRNRSSSELADHVFITDLVGRERVLDANGKREAADAVAEISGPALGGALVAWLTAPLAIAVDAATFVVSALLLTRIRKRETVASARSSASFIDDVRTGIRVVWRDAAIRALFIATATLAFCMSFMASLYTLYALSDLGLTPTQLGITIGCGGIGALAGAALAAPAALRWGARRTPDRRARRRAPRRRC